jgi:hypothetical protein
MNTTDGTSQKIRLTGTPVACASCYGQYTDRRHVDFGSSTDGAVLAGPSNIAGGKGQSIDEVIICDECLTAAAALIGLEDSAPLHAEVDELQKTVDDLAERLARTTAYVETLEQAAQTRERLATLIGG